MKLVIVSNMAHYMRDGQVVGHGATARELSELAVLFEQVRHVACMHDEPPPKSAAPYTASNIQLVAVPPAGGESLGSKFDIIRMMPLYARTIQRELRDADVVHVRCPANISMLAIMMLGARAEPKRRWVKYAGNWNPLETEPLSYMLQRKWLERGLARAEVTVNGAWPEQSGFVHTILNPCLTDDEVLRGRKAAGKKRLEGTTRLLFVGHLGAAKNPCGVVEALGELCRSGIAVHLDIVGEGDDRDVRARARSENVEGHVTVHGALGREALDSLYAEAHFVVLASRTEGWPKVLSEGMAFGAIPIASAVGSIPDVLTSIGVGRALDAPTGTEIARAIFVYLQNRERWARESELAVVAAGDFTYSQFRSRISRLLNLPLQAPN